MLFKHAYETIPLFYAGIALAIWLIGLHAWFVFKPSEAQAFLKKFPRNAFLGQILLGLGLGWFWLLIAPSGLGKLSSLAMNLGEFNNIKPMLRIAIPILLVLLVISVKDFLAVRALGLLGLLAASPLLEAAFLKDPATRLLIPIYAYSMLTASLFFVGMPYLFRDGVTWICEQPRRWQFASIAGLFYGTAVLICAVLYWRNY